MMRHQPKDRWNTCSWRATQQKEYDDQEVFKGREDDRRDYGEVYGISAECRITFSEKWRRTAQEWQKAQGEDDGNDCYDVPATDASTSDTYVLSPSFDVLSTPAGCKFGVYPSLYPSHISTPALPTSYIQVQNRRITMKTVDIIYRYVPLYALL